jgi:glycosyltransferase involved in cell wall biosynthesis
MKQEGRSGRPRISVAMNTRNEERRLPYALRSVRPWVDEIVVVDMESEDRTVDVARSFGAKVYHAPQMGFADPAREATVAACTGEWILVLDADELVPRSLADRLRGIAEHDEADVVVIPFRNYLLGAPLEGSGWAPHQDSHPRFFRRGMVRVRAAIHAYLEVAPQARVLTLEPRVELCIAHFNYLDVTHFLEKLNRYTSIEALAQRDRPFAGSPVRAFLEATREFARRYLRQGGYRDGWRGYYLALLMAGYRIVTQAKIRLLGECGTAADIERAYEEQAELLLKAYDAGSESERGEAHELRGPVARQHDPPSVPDVLYGIVALEGEPRDQVDSERDRPSSQRPAEAVDRERGS